MARSVVAARRYAEAAFEVALRDGQLDRWRDDLVLAADVLGRPEVATIVDSPAVPLARRLAVVEQLVGSRIGGGALKLVNLLVGRGRTEALGRVSEEYRRMLNAHRGIVAAIVASAVPLSTDETAAIRQRVEAMAGSQVDLRLTVDPTLLGGLTVQVRDRLLDASIRGRLERLRAQLNAGDRLR